METGKHLIAIDIETVANEESTAWWDEFEIEAPKNYKDPEKIKALEIEKRKALYGKSALTWHTGKVFSFATVSIEDPTKKFFMHSLDEKDLLETLSLYCKGQELWSKSGLTFDYGFIVGRMMKHGVDVPTSLDKFQLAKDVDNFFGRSAASGQRLSLNAYAHGLGIGGKDGSYKIVGKVYDQMITGDVNEADVEELKRYNLRDAEIVAEMVRRYRGYKNQ